MFPRGAGKGEKGGNRRQRAVVSKSEMCSNSCGMTVAEDLFERYCREREIEIRRLEECSFKTPDYEIQIGQLVAAVEVKQLEPNAEDKEVIEQLRQRRPVAHWENMERP